MTRLNVVSCHLQEENGYVVFEMINLPMSPYIHHKVADIPPRNTWYESSYGLSVGQREFVVVLTVLISDVAPTKVRSGLWSLVQLRASSKSASNESTLALLGPPPNPYMHMRWSI